MGFHREVNFKTPRPPFVKGGIGMKPNDFVGERTVRPAATGFGGNQTIFPAEAASGLDVRR
jgi:hypothetical protein